MSFPAAIDPRRIQLPRVSIPRVGVPSRRPSRIGLLAALLVLAVVLAGAWLLVRNSSLVAVQQVKIVGLSGYYDKDARAAVVDEAMQMTTMNFDDARVEQAAAQFVDVAGVHVETDFPHGATIRFDVRRPVLIARINGRAVTLSQAGEIINPTHAVAGLPKIETVGRIADDHVVSGRALQAVKVLGAAPDVLLRKVDKIDWGKLGIVVSLRGGPDLYFGTEDDAAAKWRDAATVLASEQSRGAAYLDLRVPGRTAVGGLGGAPLPEATNVSTDSTTDGAAATTTSTATDADQTRGAPADDHARNNPADSIDDDRAAACTDSCSRRWGGADRLTIGKSLLEPCITHKCTLNLQTVKLHLRVAYLSSQA
ncbi:MAG: cell division protein FtsQ/DivIB [Solirubrobacterales bacterium]